jgi:hypothetical protein
MSEQPSDKLLLFLPLRRPRRWKHGGDGSNPVNGLSSFLTHHRPEVHLEKDHSKRIKIGLLVR